MDIIVLCLCAFNNVPLNAVIWDWKRLASLNVGTEHFPFQIQTSFIFHFYFIIMVRATKTSVGDPITLDYVKGILNVIQSRTKATRSVNDHSGTKLTKQKAECVQFREVFPSAKMSEETLKLGLSSFIKWCMKFIEQLINQQGVVNQCQSMNRLLPLLKFWLMV